MSLTLKGITKSYAEREVLRDFSYDFGENGVYVLKGESGSGKTTLLRIISGIDRDYAGSVEGSCKRFAVAFQEYRLFPTLSALSNASLAVTQSRNDSRKSDAVAEKMLTDLGFKESELHLLPSELSGGMKQRVSIARALLADSDAVLLDEPTKELDPALCKRVNELIKITAEKKPVIVITHRSEDVIELGGTVIEIPTLH